MKGQKGPGQIGPVLFTYYKPLISLRHLGQMFFPLKVVISFVLSQKMQLVDTS